MIGFAFSDNRPVSGNEEKSVNEAMGEKAVISLVKVKFEDSNMTLDYFNDKFDLHEGDRVFVEGKMEGKIGEVVEVATKFRINVKNYRRVIAHPTISFDGKFSRMNDKMIAYGRCHPDPDMFRNWIRCSSGEDVEIMTGEPFCVDLEGFGSEDGITEKIFAKAINYCQDGRVVYLRVDNGRGTAFVRGHKWYEVNFTIRNGCVDNIECDCPYPYFCKHAVAMLITLKMLFNDDKTAQAECFTAIDRAYFWRTLSEGCNEIAV